MIADLRMAWAFFVSLRKWRRNGIGVVAVDLRTDVAPPTRITMPQGRR